MSVVEHADALPLDGAELDELLAYWDAANYLTVAQIYLLANPLLREPLRAEHIKPRLLGHWGTSPGLNLVYAQLNRLIRRTGSQVLYVAGPGHGGPAIVANVYLEGTYSEIYPQVSADEPGLLALVRQFSTPGGIPSHVGVPTPGSIHEGGELGYALMHAFGAAFDNPDLLVACVIGDGEAETAPLEGSWKGIRFLDPAQDGAVLPILHLNEHKISGPTVLGRAPEEDVLTLLRGHGYAPVVVAGDDPRQVHRDFAAALDGAHAEIRAIQADARSGAAHERGTPRWPAIVLRTPKGWTGPRMVAGNEVEGTWRSHQVPLAGVRENPGHLADLERWMRSYRPEHLFDESGAPLAQLAALAPQGDLRMGALPHANGGRVLEALKLPDPAAYALPVDRPAATRRESTRQLGELLRDVYAENGAARNFRLFCPDETNSNRLGSVFEVEDRMLRDARCTDEHVSPHGRVMEVLDRHDDLDERRRRARLPAAGRQLPAVDRRPLPAQPRLRQPRRHRQAARAAVPRHQRRARALRPRRVGVGVGRQCARRRGGGRRAGVHRRRAHPGDRGRRRPAARARPGVALSRRQRRRPHGDHAFQGASARTLARPLRFEALFGDTTNVVCAFHGYARALHQLLHGRPNAGRFHVHGYSEQGTTTTPFDMVVLNEMSRYHLVLDALRRARRIAPGALALEHHCEAMLLRHHDHIREHLEDMPEVRDWTWPETV